jgi:hypothetical protein
MKRIAFVLMIVLCGCQASNDKITQPDSSGWRDLELSGDNVTIRFREFQLDGKRFYCFRSDARSFVLIPEDDQQKLINQLQINLEKAQRDLDDLKKKFR